MASRFSRNSAKKKGSVSKKDIDFYKMSVLFFIACAVVMLILKASSTLNVRQATGGNTAYELNRIFNNPVYIGIIAVLLIASIVWYAVCRIKKKDESGKNFSSINAVAIMMYVTAFSAFFGRRVINSIKDCMFALIATIVLVLIYYISKIYYRDFLVFSIENAVLALFLYRYWHVYTTGGIIGKILLIIAAAAFGIAISVIVKSKYVSRNKSAEKKHYSLIFFPYYISLAVWSVFMLIKLPDPLGTPILTLGQMLVAFLIQYIVFAIIYTIKLINM